MRIILVRHGETQWNHSGIHQGQQDVPLNDTGEKQARKTAILLKKENICLAFSSDLKRASRTCEIILEEHNEVEHIKLKEFREQSKGIFEGRPKVESQKSRAQFVGKESEWVPKDGESMMDLYGRVVPKFSSLLDLDYDTILLVTHGGPLRCIIAFLEGKNDPCDIETPKNCSISIWNTIKKDFDLLNEISHLR